MKTAHVVLLSMALLAMLSLTVANPVHHPALQPVPSAPRFAAESGAASEAAAEESGSEAASEGAEESGSEAAAESGSEGAEESGSDDEGSEGAEESGSDEGSEGAEESGSDEGAEESGSDEGAEESGSEGAEESSEGAEESGEESSEGAEESGEEGGAEESGEGSLVVPHTTKKHLPYADILGEPHKTDLDSNQVDRVAKYVIQGMNKANCAKSDEACEYVVVKKCSKPGKCEEKGVQVANEGSEGSAKKL